jgi:CARDB.
VTTVDAPDSVGIGAKLNISATITNDGGLGTVQTAEFQFAANKSDLGTNATISATTVDLGGGETTEPMVTLDTIQFDPGTYHIAVVTDDDSMRVTVDLNT